MILYQDNFTHETQVAPHYRCINILSWQLTAGRFLQSSGASFGYMVVWIMSQKFLINIHGKQLA